MSHHSIIRSISKIMVILILLLNILTISGCYGKNNEYYDMEYDYYLKGSPIINIDLPDLCPIDLIATSQTNIFYKDEININIAYSTCFGSLRSNIIRTNYSYLNQKDKYFALYLCPYGDSEYQCLNSLTQYKYENTESGDLITKGPTFEEIQKVTDHFFLCGMPEEKALDKSYSCIDTPFYISDGSYYNHVESIKIPWDYLKQHQSVALMFVCFYYYEPSETCNLSGYFITYDVCIKISYEELNENFIKLNLDAKKWYYI